MFDAQRDKLLRDMADALGVEYATIGTILDDAAQRGVELTDWARYEWQPVGRISWEWHPPVLFHGGQAGLRVGQLILPPATTGVKPADERATYAPGVYRRDRVYMVTEAELARMFAALHPSGDTKRGGDVYRVEPLQGLERDRDCRTPGMSWQAPCARIAGIVATGVRRAPYQKAFSAEIEAARAKEEPQRRLRAFTWTA